MPSAKNYDVAALRQHHMVKAVRREVWVKRGVVKEDTEKRGGKERTMEEEEEEEEEDSTWASYAASSWDGGTEGQQHTQNQRLRKKSNVLEAQAEQATAVSKWHVCIMII